MNRITLTLLAGTSVLMLRAQDDLLSLLGGDSVGPEYVTASFKTTRLINGHSVENTGHGVLDAKINHRFGLISGGTATLFGLDEAYVRLGLDYGLTDRIMIGIGRSSADKVVDGFVKYKLLRQCQSGCGMPVTLSVVAAGGIDGRPEEAIVGEGQETEFYFTNRLYYSWQVLLARKFSESVTLQLMPGLVHRNLVTTVDDKNDLVNIGAGGRCKLTRRISVNAEYYHVLPDQGPREGYYDCVAIGFDIETGGHVFQLHFTNTTGMNERAFITETTNDFWKGDIGYGFNISRVFTVHDPKKKAREKISKEEGK